MTQKNKKLDSNDFQIVELVARGASDTEILRVYGKSRSSLTRLKSRQDFQALVEQSKSNLKTAIVEVSSTYTRQQHLEKLEKYRQDGERLGMQLLETSSMLLKLINKRLEITEAGDLSIHQISGYVKGASAAVESGFALSGKALGIERMMEIFNSVESSEDI